MKRSQLYKVFIFLSLSIAALLFEATTSIQSEHLNGKLERALHQQESRLESYLNDEKLIEQLIRQYASEVQTTIIVPVEKIEKLSQEPFTLLIYEHDRLIFWSDNEVVPSPQELVALEADPNKRLAELDNGFYEVMQRGFTEGGVRYRIIGLLPIKKNYSVNSKFLSNQFLHVPNFPQSVDLKAFGIGKPVRTKSGAPLYSIETGENVKSPLQQLVLFLLLTLAAIALILLISDIGIHFARRFNFWVGALFLLLTIISARSLLYRFSFTDYFAEIGAIRNIFEIKVLNGSLGDLFLNSLLVFWAAMFFHREFRMKPSLGLTRNKRFAITTINFSVILCSLLLLGKIFKSLVLESGLVFDFENIYNFNLYSTMAVVSTLLMMIALFLFTHRMMLITQDTALTVYGKSLALGIAISLTLPLIWNLELGIPSIGIILVSVVYILTFDLFIESKLPGFTWLVIWVSAFSAFGAVLLFNYNLEKDEQEKIEYAKQLAQIRDTIAEERLYQLRHKLNEDDSLQKLIYPAKPADIEKRAYQLRIDRYFIDDNYLFSNFTYDLYVKQRKGVYRPIAERVVGPESSLIKSDSLIPSSEYPGVFSLQSQLTGDYAVTLDFPSRSDDDTLAQLMLIFYPRRRKLAKVYSELLLSSEQEAQAGLSNYDYQVYAQGKVLVSNGFPNEELRDQAKRLAPGESLTQIDKDRSDLLYKSANGDIVIIGKALGQLTKPLSLFSYLFVLGVFLLLTLNTINFFFRALPSAIGFGFFGRSSLRNRIQTSVILLIIGSFFLIGIVTAGFFQRSSTQYHENRFQRKFNSVVDDLQHEIDYLERLGIEDINLKVISSLTSDIHRMDINIFGLDGSLITSSAEYIFEKGVLAPLMDPRAYFSLKFNSNQQKKTLVENLGRLQFKSAYIPINNAEDRAIGYLSIPYYSEDSDLRTNVYDFMGDMLNVYVFLFLIAGVIAIFVANSITRPISELGEKLKFVKLGKNEPIDWTSRDELGKLIHQYNSMIKKLEESTEKLKLSEREGAWREMAKQVAHEIKNPLTPMKLSIQYLLHAYRANPKNIEPLLNRVSQTLIEQIDGLSRIASEFSNFAQMPRAQYKKLIINDLIASIYHLYYENQREDLQIELKLPERKYVVYADKDQLLRVFGNLVKNAVQAIPEEKSGRIEIRLEAQEDQGIVIASVKDNGIGISTEMQEKVFFPKFTTKDSGMGLGLAISKSIVESLNGSIYFKTQPGRGTQFSVELPILLEVEEEVEAEIRNI